MMNTNFQQVFDLSVVHSYFEAGLCTCLQFRPAAGSADLLKRFGFRTRNKINGFGLYTTSTTALRSFFNYITSATSETFFEFDVLNSAPEFYAFTEMPVNWVGQFIYSSRNVTVDNGMLLLNETLSPATMPTVFGNLKIYFDDILNYTVADAIPSFNIRFTARATQWQYFVINRNGVPLDSPLIKGKTDVAFENKGMVTIETGEEALLLSSGDTLLSLSQVPVYKFDLVNELTTGGDASAKRSSSRMLFKGLPSADPGKSGLITLNDKIQVSSPIYIYV